MLKTECDRCHKVFNHMQDKSSSFHSVLHKGSRGGDRGQQDNYDFCPECTAVINARLGEILDAN